MNVKENGSQNEKTRGERILPFFRPESVTALMETLKNGMTGSSTPNGMFTSVANPKR